MCGMPRTYEIYSIKKFVFSNTNKDKWKLKEKLLWNKYVVDISVWKINFHSDSHGRATTLRKAFELNRQISWNEMFSLRIRVVRFLQLGLLGLLPDNIFLRHFCKLNPNQESEFKKIFIFTLQKLNFCQKYTFYQHN